jgi:hypothetical protein
MTPKIWGPITLAIGERDIGTGGTYEDTKLARRGGGVCKTNEPDEWQSRRLRTRRGRRVG